MLVFKYHSRRKVSLPLGSLARVPSRQPPEGFFPFLLSSLFDLSEEGRGGEEGSKSRVNLWVRFCPPLGVCPPSSRRLEPTWRAGPGSPRSQPLSLLGSAHRAGHACQRRPLGARGPLPSRGRAWSDPRLRAARGPRLTPRLGLRSPGSPCRTASSAPPPTCCLPSWGLPPEPEGPRKRQAPGRRRHPARLSGPPRRRLHLPLASSAPAPAPPQPLARPRGQDITWQPHTSGAGWRAPRAPTAHARPLPARERTRTSPALGRPPPPARRQERA